MYAIERDLIFRFDSWKEGDKEKELREVFEEQRGIMSYESERDHEEEKDGKA